MATKDALELDLWAPALASVLGFGSYADLYWEDVTSLAIRWEEGRVERFTTGRDSGAGLRYMRGDENRYAYADAPDERTIQALARNLSHGLPALKISEAPLKPRRYRPEILQPVTQASAESKVERLRRAQQAAALPGVRQISLSYGETTKHIRVRTSDGVATEEWRTTVTFSITVVAEKDGLLQTAHEAVSGTGGLEFFDKHDVLTIAQQVAQRALRRLGAPPAPAGEMPVIIAAEAGGTLIHEAIGHPLEADAVQKDVSPIYKGAVGKVVGHEKVSVLEDPTMPGQRGFYAFDDEGVPAQRVVLVDHGVLKTYLYDRQTALRRRRPLERPRPARVIPASSDPAHGQHVRRARARRPTANSTLRSERLLVTKMGGGQVEPATGDFVFEVEEGFLDQRRESRPAHPFRQSPRQRPRRAEGHRSRRNRHGLVRRHLRQRRPRRPGLRRPPHPPHPQRRRHRRLGVIATSEEKMKNKHTVDLETAVRRAVADDFEDLPTIIQDVSNFMGESGQSVTEHEIRIALLDLIAISSIKVLPIP